jgi:hypothetical protein
MQTEGLVGGANPAGMGPNPTTGVGPSPTGMGLRDGGPQSRVGAGLTAVERSLTYKAKGTASTGQNDVSADGTSNTGQWAGAALSASGICFWIKDSVSSGTTYGSGATCTGTAATAIHRRRQRALRSRFAL